MTHRYDDITGKKYGRLTTLKYVGKNARNRAMWLCLCECGNEKVVMVRHLKTGAIVSCGCYRIEQVIKSHLKHGMSYTKEYANVQARKRRELEKALDGIWTLEMEMLLYETFDKCAMCGKSRKLEVDHVHPLSRGGGLRPGNAVLLCSTCNRSKSDKLLKDLPHYQISSILRAADAFYIECLRRKVWSPLNG